MKYQLKIAEKRFTVEIGQIEAGSYQVDVNGRTYAVSLADAVSPALEIAPRTPSLPPPEAQQPKAAQKAAAAAPAQAPAAGFGAGTVTAPIPGRILMIHVHGGDSVSAGQTVAVMEAMKMENNLTAAISGVVKEIRVQKGSEVATGDVVMVIA